MMPTLELNGKIAWVTGASGDIGRAIADDLASWGATVVRTDLRGSNDDEEHSLDCDVTNAQAIADVIAYCDDLGGVDVLVNCAGIIIKEPIAKVSIDSWRAVMGVNLDGVFMCSHAAAVSMMNRQATGSIVNVASVQGAVARPETVAYASSKGGVRGLTISMAVALGEHGIRVNAVAPGTIATLINSDRWKDDAIRTSIEELTPIGRLGRPEDVAAAVSFLASPRAGFVTGIVLPVHGGRTLLD